MPRMALLKTQAGWKGQCWETTNELRVHGGGGSLFSVFIYVTFSIVDCFLNGCQLLLCNLLKEVGTVIFCAPVKCRRFTGDECVCTLPGDVGGSLVHCVLVLLSL